MKGAFLSGKHMKHMAVLLSIAGMLTPFKGTGCPSSADAKPRIQLSATKRNYFLNHVWDKLTLKNVPRGARISWSSSNKKVVRIREHIPNGIWYQVRRDGSATVTAIYKGKRYQCRIRVKRENEDMAATPIPTHVAGWFAMVVGGAGDCMASRIGVNRLCTELGILSFICSSLSDHGETMVRIGNDVYMTVTGFKGEKPRNYRLYRMSEVELEGYLSRYPASARVLGLAG